MEGVGIRPGKLVTQPVEDREPLAGWRPTTPYHRFQNQVPVAVNDEPDISIRKVVHNVLEEPAGAGAQCADPPSPYSADDDTVVDMRPTTSVFDLNNVQLRQPGLGLTEKDLSIVVRSEQAGCMVADDFADLQVVEDLDDLPSKKGYIFNGNDEDVNLLLEEKQYRKGVICSDEILHSVNGLYEEGFQYIKNGFQSKGAYGEAAMCLDLYTSRCFIRKKLQRQKLLKNEVKVPLMFRGDPGIPQVYGVIMRDEETEIFQEFAGLSLKKIMEEKDPSFQSTIARVREPFTVLAMALQGFSTLAKLHNEGIVHQDIKPENICLDFQTKLQLKFIDFGSSQTPGEQITEGLTNEYLSPESCRAILKVATKQIPMEEGRLGTGTDVWAMALSLLYCLLGYHVMVYVCTGTTHYEDTDPKVLQEKRIACLFKVSQLTDEEVDRKLIRPEWSNVLKHLLRNTLRVDPNQRWSAKTAVDYLTFIFTNLAKTAPKPASPKTQQPLLEKVAVEKPVTGFTKLAPARFTVKQQSSTVQFMEYKVPVQCSSPDPSPPKSLNCLERPTSPLPCPTTSTPSSPSQLPAFTDLLSSEDLTTKAPRLYRRKTRDTPYPPPVSRRGSKAIV